MGVTAVIGGCVVIDPLGGWARASQLAQKSGHRVDFPAGCAGCDVGDEISRSQDREQSVQGGRQPRQHRFCGLDAGKHAGGLNAMRRRRM
ncbi:hypothetical protein IU510_20590 [Nocardia cyriacigeorgica]|uniref:hypothetical protein n=1 Tax=Nocardia cyriacigeorgica TaxID=135487 RepID=UPI001894A10F|nr:hypothetical protein [Nocardia cyriacigeorgica]MBF6100460.1 hypothetical protein [Nocardia cyriacigeorgica]MBF6320294.1 hypothetical protein [Nocardia cyriacigeorgica]MBF6346330.1 hypothetical protein [Nocardia cyriacigeorgica]MBF6534220.1 hypothetical protein [Nocardia cyriacigeorgica]